MPSVLTAQNDLEKIFHCPPENAKPRGYWIWPHGNFDYSRITEELREITEKEFKEIYFKICDELEKEGYNFIEYEDSEEAIKETIEANEYKFRENGEIEPTP